MPVRAVVAVHPTIRTVEGGGFVVRRPFPTQQMLQYDPFLLLDHFGPVDYAPGQAVGAPAHPHRGFETVTYMLEGRSRHADSAGHHGVLGPGDVQWMTAGRGIVHAEEPDPDMLAKGGRMHGFQLWVNLPKRDKMVAPRYQEVPSARIPVAETDDRLARVKVIAGEALGVGAVIETRTPILYHHWTLRPGARVAVPTPASFNVFAYVAGGAARFGDGEGVAAIEGKMVAFGPGDAVSIASDAGAEVLLIGGEPLREPMARYGPFVMNTQGEIRQAMIDYQEGRMGRIS